MEEEDPSAEPGEEGSNEPIIVVHVRLLIDSSGTAPFERWFSRLRDRTARARIIARLDRLEATGHFGDAKPVGEGVFELRVDYGPGYRVYFGRVGTQVVLLIVGGDKATQEADIAEAKRLWAASNQGKSVKPDDDDKEPGRHFTR